MNSPMDLHATNHSAVGFMYLSGECVLSDISYSIRYTNFWKTMSVPEIDIGNVSKNNFLGGKTDS